MLIQAINLYKQTGQVSVVLYNKNSRAYKQIPILIYQDIIKNNPENFDTGSTGQGLMKLAML